MTDPGVPGDGRVVMVTGAGSGIGLAAAVAFAWSGDSVVATVRPSSTTERLRGAAEAAGVQFEIMELDVADEPSCPAAVSSVEARYGRLDVLVNNAGLGYIGTLEEISIDDLRRSMEVNFYGVARLTKAALPAMRARRSGRVIVVTSLGGTLGQPFNDAYCAAKFAVEGLFESLYPLEARFEVYTSIVEPGPVATEFTGKSQRPTGDSDPEIAVLRGRYEEMMAAGKDRAQPAEAAAEVIVTVSREERPLLRYQTSTFTTRPAGRKLSDLTGEQVTSFTSTWLDAADWLILPAAGSGGTVGPHRL